MTQLISVALCADKNIEVGLHVTLHSLVESSLHPLKIYFLQKGYSAADIERIHNTLEQFKGRYELRVMSIDDQQFSVYRGLHGNRFAFVRLMLADMLPEDRVIYLDSDLLVKKDLASVFSANLGEYVIGVAGLTTIKWSIEKTFFLSLGMAQGAKYFNSGVMLIDLEKWRRLDITSKCLEFADKYPDRLLSSDQTVLNAVFYRNNFLELDVSDNFALYPHFKRLPKDETGKIFHFVGSPKPWDFLGEFVHKNYPLYNTTLCKTVFRDYKTYLDFSLHRVKRTARLTRSYVNCLKKRFG